MVQMFLFRKLCELINKGQVTIIGKDAKNIYRRISGWSNLGDTDDNILRLL